MSLTLGEYKQGTTYIEYRWDKYNGYELFVGEIVNGIVRTTYHNTYGTKELARKAFNRQVKKVKELS